MHEVPALREKSSDHKAPLQFSHVVRYIVTTYFYISLLHLLVLVNVLQVILQVYFLHNNMSSQDPQNHTNTSVKLSIDWKRHSHMYFLL